MKKYTPEEIEQMSDDALKEIHQHTMLCDNDHEEHIFLCGFNSGFHAKCEDLSKNKINNKNGILSESLSFLDYTFATRLKSFVSDVQINDQMGFEEKEYIEKIANELLEYQKQNAFEQWEKDYLKRCHK